MKINRTKVIDIINKELIYYKYTLNYDIKNNIINVEYKEFSYGHIGWEEMDKISNCGLFTFGFKTKNKNNIPDNIEELLIESMYKKIHKEIKSTKKELIRITNKLNKKIEEHELYLNCDLFKTLSRKDKLNSL